MKKTAPFILCLLFLCCSLPAFSQVPGYMGKKFSVNYDPQMMYAFIAQYFDVHHNASVEYVTSLRSVVGVRYGFSNLKNEHDTDDYSLLDDYIEARDKVHAFYFYGKFFSKRRGFIAPAGAYTSVGLCFMHGKAVTKEAFVKDQKAYEDGDELAQANNGGFFVAKGRQFIVKDRIILDIAGQLGIPFIWKIHDSDYESELQKRMALSYIFRVQLGVGFLAF